MMRADIFAMRQARSYLLLSIHRPTKPEHAFLMLQRAFRPYILHADVARFTREKLILRQSRLLEAGYRRRHDAHATFT